MELGIELGLGACLLVAKEIKSAVDDVHWARDEFVRLPLVVDGYLDALHDAMPAGGEASLQVPRSMERLKKTLEELREYVRGKAGLRKLKLLLGRSDIKEELAAFDQRMKEDVKMIKLAASVKALVSAPEPQRPKVATGQKPKLSFALPPPPDSFYGRDAVLSELVRLVLDLAPGRGSRTLLHSPCGGFGKSTVLASLVNDDRIVSPFKGATFYLDCRNLSTASATWEALQQALGLDGPATAKDQVMECVRQRGKSLIVLDNYETVVDGGGQGAMELIGHLVAPQLSVLVAMRGTQAATSFSKKHIVALDSLERPAAVQLYRDRPFDYDDSDEAVTELVKEVNCIPLAVHLLASYESSASATLKELQEKQADFIAAIEEPDSHSVTLSIDMSLDMSNVPDPLRSNIQDALSVLGYLPTGAQQHALVKILSDGGLQNVTQVLVQLRRKSLAEWSKEPADDSGVGLLSMMKMRVNARFPLAARPPLLAATRSFYLDDNNYPWPLRGEALSVYINDSFNRLRCAGDITAPFHFAPFSIPPDFDWAAAEQAIRCASHSNPLSSPVLRASFHQLNESWIAGLRNVIADAERRSRGPSGTVAHPEAARCLALCLQEVGVRLMGEGNARSAESLSEARDLFEVLGEEVGVEECVGALGKEAWYRGDRELAASLIETSRAMCAAQGYKQGEAYAVRKLGDLKGEAGDLEGAIVLLAQARHAFEQLDDSWGVAECLESLGQLRQRQGDLAATAALLQEAKALYTKADNATGVANTMYFLALLQLQQDGPTPAVVGLLKETQAKCEADGNRLGVANVLAELGRTRRTLHDFAEAYSLSKQALEMYEDMGMTSSVASCLIVMAVARAATGDVAEAKELWTKAEASPVRKAPLTGLLGLSSFCLEEGERCELDGADEQAKMLYTAAASVLDEGSRLHLSSDPDHEALLQHLKATAKMRQLEVPGAA